ncbi:uncharacterized protein LOC141904435 [Tubulanus polymorphus]|uniref:uncharacterized protein LOC141904435 n=1 Tax=Tubulanus polymorphus TaxID=672921 RepID=UPI003DA50008
MAVTTVGLLIFLSCFVSVELMNSEAKLIKSIKDGYEKAGKIARPVKQPNETMKVDVGLALIHINEMNHELSALSLNAWLRMSWKDEFLKWDPAEFDGIDVIRIPIHFIWKPDIVLYNKAYIDGYGGMMITEDAMAVVFSSGHVLWIPPVLIVSLCPGAQGETTSCTLKFGSWTYDGFLLDIDFFEKKKSIDTNDYIPDHRYELMKTNAAKNTKYYPCCKEPYPDLMFELTFKNRKKNNNPLTMENDRLNMINIQRKPYSNKRIIIELMNPEAKLIKAIKDGYEKAGKIARPVKQLNETMKVDVGLALIHINEMNHKLSALSLNAWLRMSWKDEFLIWDPAKFDGIDVIRIPIHYIWKPDIVLYNKAYIDGYGGMMITEDAMAVVFSSGDVLWVPPVLIVSLCPGNQGETTSCTLKFGSWTYDGFLLDIDFFEKKKLIDTNDYIPDHRYELMKTNAAKNTKYYPCCKEPYPDLLFELTFKNRKF